ncbi:hypothetical protein ScPMuIL_004062 [Solemya velum]
MCRHKSEYQGGGPDVPVLNCTVSVMVQWRYFSSRLLIQDLVEMADKLLNNVFDILDSAHSQRLQLTELLDLLQESKDQVCTSANKSRVLLKDHFDQLKTSLNNALDKRLAELMLEVSTAEESTLVPLEQCEEMITHSISAAQHVMDEGKVLLSGNPDEDIEKLVRFRDNADIKAFNSLPEVPNLSDVPYISTELSKGLQKQLEDTISVEGRIISHAPAKITDIVERPGSLLVKWTEVDEETELVEFSLQYCYGSVRCNESVNATFHEAYTGSATSHTIKHLRVNTPYSFRVRCRTDSESPWSVWSVPKTAVTTIMHYQWSSTTEGYCTSNEDKTATRMSTGKTRVVYSSTSSYTAGFPITFRFLDSGERTPNDGIGLAISSEKYDTLQQEDAIFVTTAGVVFVDGQEMKLKLSPLGKGSSITFETENLSNGKVRVNIEVGERAVTVDWKVPQSSSISPGFGLQDSTQGFYFAMQFSHEDWKVAVE